ncbi:Aste57867_23545 [Aphanomyces stellatus]|uniref:Aste57867_23545 protein n=1 Tax=Aphanomyces stellatus TaxID=120398 RepID=A0A485LN40_9STRA|nr:hypothetical protein As57867_023474 [Aphanomyces stellatus]VFU00190.1 Aste57867_23545 [Aphanomyces stellatus]
MLPDANKYARLTFATKMVGSNMAMDPIMDCVHLDEKWFYITRETRKFYLVPGEKGPDRKCKSKRYITKVMFLSAVARPRYLDDTGEWWDGKIGTWPFTEVTPAVRSSVNRPAGILSAVARPRYLDDTGEWWDGKIGTWPFTEVTPAVRSSVNRPALETKSTNVTKNVYRTFLVERVLPAIVLKWPGPRNVKLQHDNARAHVTGDDAGLRAAFSAYANIGWNFSLFPQPPNSPDTNILDLGFFAAIQSLQHRTSARSIDELVVNVVRAFDEFPLERLERTFLTLQACLIACDHERRRGQHLQGRLPMNAICPCDVFEAAKAKLNTADAAFMDSKVADELREDRATFELARALEAMGLDDDVADALDDLGVELICLDDERVLVVNPPPESNGDVGF